MGRDPKCFDHSGFHFGIQAAGPPSGEFSSCQLPSGAEQIPADAIVAGGGPRLCRDRIQNAAVLSLASISLAARASRPHPLRRIQNKHMGQELGKKIPVDIIVQRFFLSRAGETPVFPVEILAFDF